MSNNRIELLYDGKYYFEWIYGGVFYAASNVFKTKRTALKYAKLFRPPKWIIYDMTGKIVKPILP